VDGFLKEMAPHLSHIALIFNPGAAPCARHFLQSVTLGAEATLVPVRNDSEIDAAWKQLQANRTAA